MKRLLMTSALCCGMAHGVAIPETQHSEFSKKWLTSCNPKAPIGASSALSLQKHSKITNLPKPLASIGRLLSKEEVIEALSEGMGEGWKSCVIQDVAKVDPSKWTPEFTQTVNALSVGMNGCG